MKILLTGGGTGGHIYPALTLWRYMRERHPDAEFLYVGTEQGLERDIVGHTELPFRSVSAAGLKRQISIEAVRTLAKTYRGYRQARRIIREFKPDVVVGTGGYVTLPVVYAASAANVPSVIWEANARPGLTNQLCARKAHAVAISFSASERWFNRAQKVVLTGNPRASEVINVDEHAVAAACETYGVHAGQKLIVAFFGSRGAETVNRVMIEVIPRLRGKPDWKLIYVTGEKHYSGATGAVGDCPSNVKIVPFIYDMPSLLPSAAVVVTRAGGATLAEICSLGLASILIPSPYVTANHQVHNAQRLVEHDAARMISEGELTVDLLWDELASLVDTRGGASLRAEARKMATPDAVEALYELVMDAVRVRVKDR